MFQHIHNDELVSVKSSDFTQADKENIQSSGQVACIAEQNGVLGMAYFEQQHFFYHCLEDSYYDDNDDNIWGYRLDNAHCYFFHF